MIACKVDMICKYSVKENDITYICTEHYLQVTKDCWQIQTMIEHGIPHQKMSLVTSISLMTTPQQTVVIVIFTATKNQHLLLLTTCWIYLAPSQGLVRIIYILLQLEIEIIDIICKLCSVHLYHIHLISFRQCKPKLGPNQVLG